MTHISCFDALVTTLTRRHCTIATSVVQSTSPLCQREYHMFFRRDFGMGADFYPHPSFHQTCAKAAQAGEFKL